MIRTRFLTPSAVAVAKDILNRLDIGPEKAPGIGDFTERPLCVAVTTSVHVETMTDEELATLKRLLLKAGVRPSAPLPVIGGGSVGPVIDVGSVRVSGSNSDSQD